MSIIKTIVSATVASLLAPVAIGQQNPNISGVVASGSHIHAGIELGTIPNLRVAPTIAKLLGVSLPAAKEQPLDSALQ
jgi:hypothetical protein